MNSRRIVIEFDFPDCGDERLSGKTGLMTRALECMAAESRRDTPDGRGVKNLGYAKVRWVHSYYP